uniref:Maturase K n=1 Tax=Panagrolaimus davidi TaxID=227884 RepID=A0A914PSU3_9BILA
MKIKSLKHCITSNLLKSHEWTLFLSPDTGIINPHRLIEDFILYKNANIIFYDEIHNWEISSESYLARNTTFAKDFLLKLAQMEFYLPQSLHGCVNEAIHVNDLEVFKACSRQIIGERHRFCINTDCFLLLPKRKAWIRNGLISDSKWSMESDFMFNGWKESYRIPTVDESYSWTRASRRLLSSAWFSPLAPMMFEKKACINRTILWKWYKSFLISNSELDKLLNDVQSKAQENYLKAVSLIPNYL